MATSTAVSPTAVARVVGIKTEFKDLRQGNIMYLPQHLAVIGQGNSASVYSGDKFRATTAQEVGERVGYGSPLHLAARELFPVSGDGVGDIPVTFFPLSDASGAAEATGSITPSGTATAAGSYVVTVNNIQSEAFRVEVDDTVAQIITKATEAVNATLNMPVIATDSTTSLDLAAKWAGESGNDIVVAVEGPDDTGITFAVTQLTGGNVNPDVQDALDQFGNVWYSMVLNCLNHDDTDALDAISDFGEGRWGALVRKPFVSFAGNTIAAVGDAITVSSARASDRVNGQLVSPGSNDLPLVVVARQLARVLVRANSNPAYDYGGMRATRLVPGPDGDQWSYPERDQAVKAGSSTVEVRDGVVTIGDVVTFYHPTGEAVPPYRYLVDIVKLQTILFNMDLLFLSPGWDGAPLIPDDQPTTNRAAKRPKDAVTAIYGVLESLGLNAIISDVPTAKAKTVANINEQNPKRLDASTTVQLSGNTNIISADLNFGFFFGTAPIV